MADHQRRGLPRVKLDLRFADGEWTELKDAINETERRIRRNSHAAWAEVGCAVLPLVWLGLFRKQLTIRTLWLEMLEAGRVEEVMRRIHNHAHLDLWGLVETVPAA